jgi:hypothetical protein
MYQVMDQRNPAQAILSCGMLPQEEISNDVLNGVSIASPEPNWVNVMGGTSSITAGRTNTDANGKFEDAPIGFCSSLPYVLTFTQTMSVLLGIRAPCSY